jgi:hypothetical protein
MADYYMEGGESPRGRFNGTDLLAAVKTISGY